MRAWRNALSLIAVMVILGITFGIRSASSNTIVSQKPGSVNPGYVVVTGTLVEVEGVECPRMVFLQNYQLVGDLQGFGPGDTVTVTGALDVATTCQQGTPLRVISIK